MKARVFTILVIVVVTASIGLIAQQESSTPPSQSDPATQSAIVSKLEEIVNIRERILRSVKLNRSSGRAADDGAAEVALADARIELARERDQPEAVVQVLQNLVAIQQQRVHRAERLANSGNKLRLEVEKTREDLLKAEVRLLRARE